MATIGEPIDGGPCPCCDCMFTSCSAGCCPDAPVGLVSQYISIVPTTAVVWDNSILVEVSTGTGSIGMSNTGDCSYFGSGGDTGDDSFDWSLICCDDIWYVVFHTFEMPSGVCPYIVWVLDSYDCCIATQTVGATALDQAAIEALDPCIFPGIPCSDPTAYDPPLHLFHSWPTEFTFNNPCGCPESAPAAPMMATAKRLAARPRCRFIGDPTDELIDCASCGGGRVKLKLFGCQIFGTCTPFKPVEGTACCVGCDRYEPRKDSP